MTGQKYPQQPLSRFARLFLEGHLEWELPFFSRGDVEYREADRLSVLVDAFEDAISKLDKMPSLRRAGQLQIIALLVVPDREGSVIDES